MEMNEDMADIYKNIRASARLWGNIFLAAIIGFVLVLVALWYTQNILSQWGFFLCVPAGPVLMAWHLYKDDCEGLRSFDRL